MGGSPPKPQPIPDPPPRPSSPNPVASELGSQNSLQIKRSTAVSSLASGKKKFRNSLQIQGSNTGLNIV